MKKRANLFSNLFMLGEDIFSQLIKDGEDVIKDDRSILLEFRNVDLKRTDSIKAFYEFKDIRNYLKNEFLSEIQENSNRKKIKYHDKTKTFLKKFYDVAINKNIIEKINEGLENSIKNMIKEKGNSIIHVLETEVVSKHPGVILSSGNYINLIMENGIFFDVFTNAPKIPESSINGALRRILNFKLNKERKESSKLIKLTTISLLGIPQRENRFYKIITMNNSYLKNINKYKDIYDKICKDLGISNFKNIFKQKIMSTEFLDPLPIHLIVIPENIKFKIFFIFTEEYPKEKIKPNKSDSFDVLLSTIFSDLKNDDEKQKFLEVLKLLFEIYGLGAKTAYGFGKFKIKSMRWLEDVQS